MSNDFLSALSQGLLEYLVNGTPLTVPSTWWVSLHHSSPYSSQYQNSYEVEYAGYERQPIERGSWNVSVTGRATNSDQITFPEPTALGNEGHEVHWVGLGRDQTGPGSLFTSSNSTEDPVFLILPNAGPIVIPVGGLRLSLSRFFAL